MPHDALNNQPEFNTMPTCNSAALLPFLRGIQDQRAGLHELAFLTAACSLADSLFDWQRQPHADHDRIVAACQTVHDTLDQLV